MSDILKLPVPDGADEQVFAMLKEALFALVLAQNDGRAASAVPAGSKAYVADLRLSTDPWELNWTYVNPGDYDQNTLVAASDLTPVGVYYGARAGDANWEHACLADGNGDGEITVADLTPIGQNYGNSVTGYEIYSSYFHEDHPQFNNGEPGEFTVWVDDYSTAVSGSVKRSYSYALVDPEPNVFYWVVPTDGTSTGMASNIIGGDQTLWPVVTGLAPLNGLSGTQITITGHRFGAEQGDSFLSMNGSTVPVVSWSDDEITATIPPGVGSAAIRVNIDYRFADTPLFTVSARPVISGVSPMQLEFGKAFTVFGEYFGSKQGAGSLLIDGVPHPLATWSDGRIDVAHLGLVNGISDQIKITVLASNGLESTPVYVGGSFVSGYVTVTPRAGQTADLAGNPGTVFQIEYHLTNFTDDENYYIQLIPNVTDLEAFGIDENWAQPGIQFSYGPDSLAGEVAVITPALHFHNQATGHEFILAGPGINLVRYGTPYIAGIGVHDYNRGGLPAPNDFCYTPHTGEFHDFTFIDGEPLITSALADIEVAGEAQPFYIRDLSSFRVGEPNERPYCYRYYHEHIASFDASSITVIRGQNFGEEKGEVWLDAGPGGTKLLVVDYHWLGDDDGWNDDEIRFHVSTAYRGLSGQIKVVKADGDTMLYSPPLVCSPNVLDIDTSGNANLVDGQVTVTGMDLYPPEIPGMTGTDTYSIWMVRAGYTDPWTGSPKSALGLLTTPVKPSSTTDTTLEFSIPDLDLNHDGLVPVEVISPWGDEALVVQGELLSGQYYFFLWTGVLATGSPQEIANSGIFSELYEIYVDDWSPANLAPIAVLNADPVIGIPPLTVTFDGRSSHDSDGEIVDYEWDLDGDAVFNEGGAEANARGTQQVLHTYVAVGAYNVALRVTDDLGAIDVDHALITVPSETNQITVSVTLEFNGFSPVDTAVRLYNGDPEAGGTILNQLNADHYSAGDGNPATVIFDHLVDGDYWVRLMSPNVWWEGDPWPGSNPILIRDAGPLNVPPNQIVEEHGTIYRSPPGPS